MEGNLSVYFVAGFFSSFWHNDDDYSTECEERHGFYGLCILVPETTIFLSFPFLFIVRL